MNGFAQRPYKPIMSAHLLAVVELGGYPNFAPLYRAAGYDVHVVALMRKAVKLVKQIKPAVIVAEFNYQPDFRERVSNLEPLLASVQGLTPKPTVIVFYDPVHQTQLDKLHQRFDFFQTLAYPLDPARVQACLPDSRR
jgi:hypothetical protein